MAQRNPQERSIFEKVIELASQLSTEEQAMLTEEFLKLQRLRQKLAAAECSLERGEGISAEEAFA